MIALYIICLISIASCDEVNENGQEISSQNTTTLYPVRNVPFHFKESKEQENNVANESNDEQTDIATSKHNRYTHTDVNNFKEAYKTNHVNPSIVLKSNESKDYMINNTIIPSKEVKLKTITTVKEGTRWKIDATYAPSKEIDESRFKDFERKEKIKDFKPSPHLGSFNDDDEDSFVVPAAKEGSFTPYRPESVGSSEKEVFKMSYKRPVDSYQTPIDTPYRYENVPRTPDWHIEPGFEPRTTVEPPVKIPAGGLYKLPDPFQEKPNSDGDNEDFGLEFKIQKDNSVKKRGNPWKSFLHMVTALLPVGLVVAALTPNVVTFENTDNNNPYYPSGVSRRADEMTSSPPRISERCKRRLLCEIHADHNYNSNLSVSQRKPCYKLHCEDPQALSEVLRWLLNHHYNHHTPIYRPADHDRRGYIRN